MAHCSNAYPDKAKCQDLAGFKESPDSLIALLRKSVLFVKSRNCVNSDEYKLDIDGRDVFVKTYINRNWLIRTLFGRIWTLHEFAANKFITEKRLMRAAEPICIIGKCTLLLQFIHNTGHLENPKHHKDFIVPGKYFFTELIDGVRAMHKSGICHGDIRRANILIGTDRHPWLVDTASAIVLGKNPGFMKKWAFKCMAKSDMFSLAKIVLSYYPDWEDEELLNAYNNPPLYLKIGRYIRQYIFSIFRSKKRKKLSVK